MSKHSDAASPPPRTYTPRIPAAGPTLTCSRCGRVHAYPEAGGPAIRCECGWWYENHEGLIHEAFKSRLGV